MYPQPVPNMCVVPVRERGHRSPVHSEKNIAATHQRATLSGAEQCATYMQQQPPDSCKSATHRTLLECLAQTTWPRRATPLRAPHLAMVRFSSENSYQGIPPHFLSWCIPHSTARLPPLLSPSLLPLPFEVNDSHSEQDEHEFFQDLPWETSPEIYVNNTGGC